MFEYYTFFLPHIPEGKELNWHKTPLTCKLWSINSYTWLCIYFPCPISCSTNCLFRHERSKACSANITDPPISELPDHSEGELQCRKVSQGNASKWISASVWGSREWDSYHFALYFQIWWKCYKSWHGNQVTKQPHFRDPTHMLLWTDVNELHHRKMWFPM